MARASAPPWEPTPRCRIAAVRAAISPSLSAKSRLETYFRTTPSPHLDGLDILGINVLLIIHDAVFYGGNFLHFRQRTDPLIIIELFRGWVFFFL